ncbi:MAG: histidine kinase [Mucilaginibacter polytrichastri]|nr:histidine kinase [Mucilaginibacter polytrichastri]
MSDRPLLKRLITLRPAVPSAQLLILGALLAFSLLPLMIPIRFPPEFWIKQLCCNLIWFALFVFNQSFIVPRLLFRNRPGLFILAAIACVLLVFQAQRWIDQLLHLSEKMNAITKDADSSHGFIGNLIVLVVTLIVLGASTISKINERLTQERQKQQLLESDKIISELSYLKSQINPHFFFNILHTIYALIETDKEKARESVYTLSHMMRYVLYDTEANKTLLEKEVGMIDDYLTLMKLRLHDNVQVIFEKPAALPRVQIAPMLFLPLIENAFKHGVSSSRPCYIYIALTVDDASIMLEVKNTLIRQKAEHTERSNGIGLVNTRRRLEIIYPEAHTFTVSEDQRTNEFSVNLTLQT